MNVKAIFVGFGIIVTGGTLAACGKCGDQAATEPSAEVTQAAPIEGASTVVDLQLPTTPEPGTPDDAGKEELLNALLVLEIPGMSRSRAARNGDLVTLQFDNLKANDAGNVGTVEVTAGFCAGCKPVGAGIDDETRLASEKEALGELHAGNADLVIEFGEFELAPQRNGAKIYRRSFVAKDEARAAVHTFDVEFHDANRMIRLTAYPRTGFPADAEAFEAQYTRGELEDDVKKVFAAAMPVIWTPVPL